MGRSSHRPRTLPARAANTLSCRRWFTAPWIMLPVTRIAGRGGAGDRREPRPAQSGRRPGPRSTSRSIPGAGSRALAEHERRRGQSLMLSVHVPHLGPDHHRVSRRAGRAPGHFRQSRAGEEHHPGISRSAELPADRQARHVAVETAGSAGVGGAQQNPAAQYVHGTILAACCCPVTGAPRLPRHGGVVALLPWVLLPAALSTALCRPCECTDG
jgi:hypothetical protein